MSTIKLKAVFKDYEGLLDAFNTDRNKEIDSDFDSALKKMANQRCILVSYKAKDKIFDATFIVDKLSDPTDPTSPLISVQEIPFGIFRRYTQNLGLNVLVDGSIDCEHCDESIYCTGCGYQVQKSTRYDYEPLFSYGDIFNQHCESDPTGNKSGAVISLNACDDHGNMYCPACLSMQKFEEISSSLT